jgi:hypothetical protein
MMDKAIVQINFQFGMSLSEFVAFVRPLAEPIAAVDGLLWKIWLLDEEKCTSGGVYLFESLAAAQQYLAGPIVAGLAQNPQFMQIEVKVSGVAEELSALTYAPLTQLTA